MVDSSATLTVDLAEGLAGVVACWENEEATGASVVALLCWESIGEVQQELEVSDGESPSRRRAACACKLALAFLLEEESTSVVAFLAFGVNKGLESSENSPLRAVDLDLEATTA